jgi:hypothetical protein
MNLNYDDVKIDPSKLDEEWIKQPYLFQQFAEKVVEYEDVRDRLKRKSEVVYAETEKAIRKEYSGRGEKITEATVKALITTNADVQQVEQDLLTAVKNAKIAGVAVKAFEHKKKALENLTTLYVQGYSGILQSSGKVVNIKK